VRLVRAETVPGGIGALVQLPYDAAAPRARARFDELAALPDDALVGHASEIGALGTFLWDDAGRHELLDRAVGAGQDLDALLEARSLAELWGGTARRAVESVGSAGNAAVMAWTDHPRDLVRSVAAMAGASGIASLATRDLAEGRYGDAYDALLPLAEDRSLPAGPSYFPDLVEAAVRADRPEVAERFVTDLEERARVNGSAWCAGVAARSRALVAPAEKAEKQYRTAIELLAGTFARMELARAHLLYGEWMRRAGRPAEAGRQLQTAYDLLELTGATMFGPRVRAELAAAGAEVPNHGAAPCHELTPQEQSIARLAGEGRTSAEIGRQLLISPSTVDHHLRNMFLKLGISSRRQLLEMVAA
jgi:DNA-binding CsgD family transcriptional regulator